MKKHLVILLLAISALFPASIVAQHTTYYGRMDAFMGLANDAISDSIRQADYIDSTQVKTGGIAGTDLRVDAIDSTKVRDGTISNADLRNDAVTGGKIQAGAVDSTDVTDGNLSGSDLANGTVSKVKIQTSSVDSTKVSDGELSGSDLADGTVSLAKIQSAAVDSTKIVDGSVSNADLRDDAVTGTKIQASAIDSTDVKDGSIAGGDIATGGITGTQIQTDAVDSTKVGDGKISGTDLASGTVSNAKLMADAVDSTKTKDGALSVSDIANGDNGFVTKPSLDDSLLNYGVRPRLNAKTWFNIKPAVGATDTAFSIISSNGNNVAFADTSGNLTVNSIKTAAFLWEVPAFHFNTYSADSATVSDLMDSTGTDVRHWFYKRTLGVNTQAYHNTILMATQVPSSVTPDSLIFKMRSTAGSDSATVQCIVKNAAGTILKNTGQIAATLMDTWEYKNYGAISAMTENQPCAYQFIIRTKYNAQVDVSSLYFK